MAITTWFDEGMTWTSLVGKPFNLRYPTALNKAFIERKQGGQGIGGTEEPDPVPGELPLRAKFPSGPSALPSLHALWFRVIDNTNGPSTQYINHLDNAGDWDGTVNGPISWTLATISAAAGIGALRQSASPGLGLGDFPPINSEWAIQRHKLLNLMLWSFGSISETSKIRKSAFANDPDYSTAISKAITAYNAATPGAVPTGNIRKTGTGEVLSGSGEYRITFDSVKASYSVTHTETTFEKSFDSYIKYKAISGGTFDAQGDGVFDNLWSRRDISPDQTGSHTFDDPSFAHAFNVPTQAELDAAAPFDVKRGYEIQTSGTNKQVVTKFDKAAGFQFV